MKGQMKLESSYQKKIFLLAIYIMIIIILEILLKQTVMEKSLVFISSIQNSSSKMIITFYEKISLFGTDKIILPIIFILFLKFPLNITHTLFNIFFYCKFFDNVLKLAFASPRPFWINFSLMVKCHSGYGNPSSHCFSSTAFYLSLMHIMIQRNDKKQLNAVYIFGASVLITLIAISRIVLAVHSVDQVLFGILLGISVYFYFFFIEEGNKEIDDNTYIKDFYTIQHQNKKWTKVISTYAIFIAISILFYYIFYSAEMTSKYLETFNGLKCPVKRYGVKLPGEKALVASLNLFGVIGSYYGLIFLGHLKITKSSKLINEYEEKIKNKSTLEKIAHLAFISFVFIFILIFVFKSKRFSFSLKVPLYSFFAGFGLFGIIALFKQILNNEFSEEDGIKLSSLSNDPTIPKKKLNLTQNPEENNDEESSNLIG